MGAAPLRLSDGEDTLVSEQEEYPHVEPHLVVDPRDASHLVAAAMTLPAKGDGFRIRVYVSEDGGATWTGRPLQAGDHAGAGDDPWLAFGPDRILYLSHLPGVVWRSKDGGRSWEPPTRLPAGDGGHYDAPKLAVDRTDGRRRGHVYVAATQTVRDADEGAVAALAIIPFTGTTAPHGPSRLLHNDFQNKNGDLAVLQDGTVLALWHELFHEREAVESPRLWSVTSRDGGRTFSTPSLVTSGFRSLSPQVALDNSKGAHRGRVYAAWLGLRGDRNHYVSHSDDAGVTWSDPASITTPRDASAYPTPVNVAVAPDGTLGLLWPENLQEMGADCFEMKFTVSSDGGASFGDPISISDEPSCSDTKGNRIVMHKEGARSATVAERFKAGGDYFGLVALPDGTFRAVWADARTGVFQLWADTVQVEGE